MLLKNSWVRLPTTVSSVVDESFTAPEFDNSDTFTRNGLTIHLRGTFDDITLTNTTPIHRDFQRHQSVDDEGIFDQRRDLYRAGYDVAKNKVVSGGVKSGKAQIVLSGVTYAIELTGDMSGKKSTVNVYSAEGLFSGGKTAVTIGGSLDASTVCDKLATIISGVDTDVSLTVNAKANVIIGGASNDSL